MPGTLSISGLSTLEGTTSRPSSYLIQEVHETEDIRIFQSRYEVPVSIEMEEVVKNATRLWSRQIQLEETIQHVSGRHGRWALGSDRGEGRRESNRSAPTVLYEPRRAISGMERINQTVARAVEDSTDVLEWNVA